MGEVKMLAVSGLMGLTLVQKYLKSIDKVTRKLMGRGEIDFPFIIRNNCFMIFMEKNSFKPIHCLQKQRDSSLLETFLRIRCSQTSADS